VLYCVLPGRSSGSVASTSSRQDQDSVDLPYEGLGSYIAYCPPGMAIQSGALVILSVQMRAKRMINQPNPSLEGDGDLYCQLPRTG
jgi:hypothetical protein